MGRKTWESLGGKPLPGRRNLVVTSRPIPGAECFADIAGALSASEGPVWFFGGARIYEEAMAYADAIDVVSTCPITSKTATPCAFRSLILRFGRLGPSSRMKTKRRSRDGCTRAEHPTGESRRGAFTLRPGRPWRRRHFRRVRLPWRRG